ncbi:hypothetical protein AB0M02_43735 [Actinoplanes sp. NPDC051861]|uniref:hypothetical protein n=1 Tax=Actinoplanes sp. NPDC051861 TaxID=3155170 RepID=UPI00341C1EB9
MRLSAGPVRRQRWWARALTMLLMAVGVTALHAPAPAAAAEADMWGFALVDSGGASTGSTFVPDTARQDTNSGVQVTATKRGTGAVTVRFPGMATPVLGVAHVTPASQLRECQLGGGYGTEGSDVVIGVVCRDQNGQAADSKFSILYTVSSGPLRASPGAYAYLVADQPSVASYRPAISQITGDNVEVGRVGVGETRVRFDGTAFAADGGNYQITALDTPARCAWTRWSRPVPASFQVVVTCVDLAGNPVDAKFTLSFTRMRSILGTTDGLFAYLNTDRATNGSEAYNSSGQISEVEQVVGLLDRITIPLAGGSPAPFLVLAVAFGPPRAVCGISDWQIVTAPRREARGTTECFNKAQQFQPVAVQFVSPRGGGAAADTPLPETALQVTGAYEFLFNPVSAAVTYTLVGTEFDADPSLLRVRVNGTDVPASKISVQPTRAVVSSALVDGRNVIEFEAVDYVGRTLTATRTVWAGSHTLRVRVVDEAGNLATDGASVDLAISDDQRIASNQYTPNGTYEFTNVPARTVMLRAGSSTRGIGSVGVMGNAGTATVVLRQLGTPSDVNNNDFSQGTAGWNVANAPVAIVNHVEGDYQPTAGKSITGTLGAPANAQSKAAGSRSAKAGMAPAPASVAKRAAKAAAADDVDMAVFTYGQGERFVTRTFRTYAGMTDVRLRYRFITTEVPAGYYGSPFNDYYRVHVRTGGGGSAYEAASMNSLGLHQFDYYTGATRWREIRVPVNPDGDVVQVIGGVANVADPYFDSALVIDIVEQAVVQVTPGAAWNPRTGGLDVSYTIEGGPLRADTQLALYWANGTGLTNRLGGPITTIRVPAGTGAGRHVTNVPGDLLGNDPDGTTHLVVVAGTDRVASVRDVGLNFGVGARRHPSDVRLVDIVKDGLRAAGQDGAVVSSTIRRPEDQARVMFKNLTNSSRTLAQNIAQQRAEYGANGDLVIAEFERQTAGYTTVAQAVANSAAIQAAMLTEINRIGCKNVTDHCNDPAKVTVFDIASSSFGTNAGLFRSATEGRVGEFRDERSRNNCYHLSVDNP